METGRTKFRRECKARGTTGLGTEWMSPLHLESWEGFPAFQTRPPLPLLYNTDIPCRARLTCSSSNFLSHAALRRCLCISMSAPPYAHLQTVVHLCAPSTGHRASSQVQVHNTDPNPDHLPTHDPTLAPAPIHPPHLPCTSFLT